MTGLQILGAIIAAIIPSGLIIFSLRSAHAKANKSDERVEAVRLEMANKVDDLYSENKEDRKQHNEDMKEIQKSIHAMTIAISGQIKELNVMPEPNVKEYVSGKLDPIVEGLKEVKASNKDQSESNSEVARQVALLVDRSK